MTPSGWELQKALHERLATDAELTGLLGGAHIYDEVPRGVREPYVTIGETTIRDWSTGSEEGHEHLLTITVWTRANGARQTHAILGVVEGLLHNSALTLNGYRLVNLRHELSEVRRDGDGEATRGLLRLRAVTEPDI